MENDTTIAKQGLLEPVSLGSVTFENSILAPLQNNHLYEESKECFTYNSAYLINNSTLQSRYSAFRNVKRASGYSEEELEESFGFLLFDDKSRAIRLADTGLIVGQGTCTILGDCSKGVYISKYSDCLDLKRWYDGKTGYIVLLKLTKGRVKEVTENYTQNFTPPTLGYDCHVSEQLREVCATTSSFLAFERTQYYMFEHLDGGSKVEPCPRHVYPFAVVAFSYGKTTISLKKKSQEKSTFHFQPWKGQLKIGSLLYTVGLKSFYGALFPTNLPKTVQVSHAIGVSELKKTLPQAIFETTLPGEVSIDGRWFSLYDVISFESRNDLALLIQGLKEKDMALVVHLKDSGFLVLLHSSNFLSYEGAGIDKALSLQGMFIFPDSRTVPRETKREHNKDMVSAEILQVLPALNYAELEMEKSPLKQQEEPLGIVEKHLQNFAALLFPELSNSPSREASMFPDQYDVPDGFLLIAPKWTTEAGARLRTYLGNPHSFQIPVSRALELLASGKQQRTDDHDDDVYYYISSPEEAPQTPAETVFDKDLTSEPDQLTIRNDDSDELQNTAKQQTEKQKTGHDEQPHSALSEEIATLGTAVVATAVKPVERTAPSPKSGDLPIEHYVKTPEDSRKMSEENESGLVLNETPIQPTSEPLSTESGYSDSNLPSNNTQPNEVEGALSKKVDCISATLPRGIEIPVVDKDVSQRTDPPTSISSLTESLNQTESYKEVQPQTSSNVLIPIKLKRMTKRHGRRRKKKAFKRNTNTIREILTPPLNTTLSSPSPLDATPELSSSSETIQPSPDSLKRNWRSLPRRKKHWKADDSLRRTLRSDVKATSMESNVNTSESEKTTTLTELPVIENIVASTPKRKMEGFSMRERYGLKTIVTDCGRVFVPHGSDVATGDVTKQEETKESIDSSLVPTDSPTINDTAWPLESQNIPENPLSMGLSSEQMTEKTNTNTEQLSDPDLQTPSPEKMKNKKGHVYRAISISKLKTVLKRARRAKSPGTEDQGKSIPDTAEPELKKSKSSVIPDLTESQASSSQEKLISKAIPKENGCSIFESPSPFELVKQVDQQIISTFIGDRVGGKYVSSDGKSTKEGLTLGVSVPSDALNLLADLALSVNSDKPLPNLGAKPRQETHVGAKTCGSPKSVLHNLLRDPARLKLPAKSPFPEGLVVTGDLILEISKEHSYSQPTSLLSGLTGTCTKVQCPVGSVEPHLPLRPLKLPDCATSPGFQDNKGQNGWRIPVDRPSVPDLKAEKLRRSVFLHQRHVLEREGSIQVTRVWKENYDFRFDSKFTNEKLDKCVTRALHGQWDFSFEDTYEQVHLIFHMWIGLFYSKPTSRFFHFDLNCPPLKKKDLAPVLQSPVPVAVPVLSTDTSSKESNSNPLHHVSDALDLSVKLPGSVEHHSVSQRNSEEASALISCIRSRLMNTKAYKDAAIRAHLSLSPSLRPRGIPMGYRTKADVLDENSTLDNESSDLENDTTDITDSSYTQLMESNSAYNQLCEQTSSMSIDEQKLLNTQRCVLVCMDQSRLQPSMVRNDGKTSDPVVAVSHHSVFRPFRPVILSEERVSERKVIIKNLRFKYKCESEAPKNESKDDAHGKKSSESSPLLVQRHDDKDESAFKTQEAGSRSDEAMPLCHERGETCSTRKEVCFGVNTPTDSTGVTETSVCIAGNEPTCNDIEVTPMVVLDENNKETNEVEPVKDDSSRSDVRNDSCVETGVNKTTDEVTPMRDVENQTPHDDAKDDFEARDETPVDVPDVTCDEAQAKDSPVDVQNLNNSTMDEDSPELDDRSDMSVHNVNNTNKEDESKLDDGNYTVEYVQDVNRSTNEKTKLDKLDARGCSTVDEQQYVDDSTENDTEPSLDVRDCISMDEQQDVEDSTENETEPKPGVKHCIPMDEQQDVEDSTENETEPKPGVKHCIPMDEQQDVEDSTENETEPKPGVKHCIPMDEQQDVEDSTENETEPKPDVKHCIPMDEQQDVEDSTENEIEPKLDVKHGSSMDEQQDLEDCTDNETEPRLDVRDCNSVDKQEDIDDNTETEPSLDVRECSSMEKQQDVDDSTNYKSEHKLDPDHAPVVVQDLSDIEPQRDVDCIPVSMHDVNDGTNVETDSKLDVRGDTPVEVQDMNDSVNDSMNEETEPKLHVRDETPVEVQDMNDSMNEETEPKLDVRDETPVDVQDVNDSMNEDIEPKLGVRDETPVDVQDVNDSMNEDIEPKLGVRDETPVDVQDVNDSMNEDIEPKLHVRDETPVDVQDVNDSMNEDIEPKLGVRDETPVDVQDVNDSMNEDIEPKLGVRDETPVDVQDVNDSMNEETEPTIDVRDDTAVDVQDVNDSMNEDIEPKLDVRDDTAVDVQHVNDGMNVDTQPRLDVGGCSYMDEQWDMNASTNDEIEHVLNVRDDTHIAVRDVNKSVIDETKPVPGVRHCSSLCEQHYSATAENMTTEERQLKRDECNTEEVTSESERRGGAEFPCENTNTATYIVEQTMFSEPHDVSWDQDQTDCVDMDISDDQNSEDETREDVNVAGDGIVPEQITDYIISQEGGIKTSTPMVVSKQDHTGTEPPVDSSVLHRSSTDRQLNLIKEGEHSAAIGGTSLTVKEGQDHKLAVQHGIPEVIQDKAGSLSMPICTDISDPETLDSDFDYWNSAITTDSMSISNATGKPIERDGSGKDQTYEEGTDQKDTVPAIYKTSTVKVPDVHKYLDVQHVSPPGLQIDSENNVNSRSCTPTQDELPGNQDFYMDLWYQEENLRDNHSSKIMHRGGNRCNTSSPLNSTVFSTLETRVSKSSGHRAQSLPDCPFWSSGKYDRTVKPSDDLPKQNSLHFDREAISLPKDLVYSESQMDQFVSFSEQYEGDSYSELPSGANKFSFKADGLERFRKSYAHNKNEDFSMSVHRTVTHRPREIKESPSDIPSWVHYSDSNESSERVRSFRHQSDLSELTDEADSHVSLCYSTTKRKKTVYRNKWDEDNDTSNYSIRKTISDGVYRTNIVRTKESCPYERKDGRQPFDWRRYFRREGVFHSEEGNDKPFRNPPCSLVTVFDKKGNRVVFENLATPRRSTEVHGASPSASEYLHNCEDRQAKSENTQSLLEHEYLIFSEKMTHLLKQGKASSKTQSQPKLKVTPVESPMTIQFSRLEEEDSFVAFDETWPTLSKFKIHVDMSDSKGLKKATDYGKPLHLQSLFCERGNEAVCSKISDITKDFAKSYHMMMNDICAGKSVPLQRDEAKRKWDAEGTESSKQPGFCGRIKKDMFDNLHVNLNSVVRQACKLKYRFYILVTSEDPFFEETKDVLEAEGHTAVKPYEFNLDVNGQTPLLIILRNEDIAEHICEVPHLLELKKSPRVLFAGIDQPDDVINLTHQELFAKGGFVVFDETALDTLSLDNMKKMVGVMEELDKKGKWKWFLHYRDSRKLRENARCSTEAQRKKKFMDCCQEAGMVEVLPYHECDVISRDRPGYLQCLVRLQIHNVSARFPVFITDTPDDSFGKDGILTMNIYTFLRILSHDTCSVS